MNRLTNREKALLSVLFDTLRDVQAREIAITGGNGIFDMGIEYDTVFAKAGEALGVDVFHSTDGREPYRENDDTTAIHAFFEAIDRGAPHDPIFDRFHALMSAQREGVTA